MSEPQTTVVSVRCNHCGAPLEVAAGASFLTCSYCNSQLEVHRSGGAVYTEVIDQINKRTERIERDVQQIKRQNAVEQLDREWEIRRQELLVRNKDGSRDVPTMAGSAIGGIIAIVAGIAWIIFTASMGAPGFFPLFGLLFIAVGVIASISQMTKADAYSREESAYRARREALLRESDSRSS
jgi:hypothetical protein